MSREWVLWGFLGSGNSLRWSVVCYSLMGSLCGGFAPWKVPKTALMNIAWENEGHIQNQRPKVSPKPLLPACEFAVRAAPSKIANWKVYTLQCAWMKGPREFAHWNLKIVHPGVYWDGEFNAANRSSWNLFVLVQTGFEFTENWNVKYLMKKLIFQESKSSKWVGNGFLRGFRGRGIHCDDR